MTIQDEILAMINEHQLRDPELTEEELAKIERLIEEEAET